jgi:CheY-like chemotaxis protein
VRGIPADLREIVVNLILNAVDAMPSGGRLLLRGDLEDGTVVLTCQDSGAGMSAETLARVFEPFFTTKGARGTGVGLAILQAVVRRHGGEVGVASELGVGTTFTIRLPAADLPTPALIPAAATRPTTAARPPAGVPGRPHPEPRRAGGLREADDGAIAVLLAAERTVERSGQAIRARAEARAATADELEASLASLALLVVDDDPIFRAAFARRLELDARRVEAVGDAATALTLVSSGEWDVVCLDDGLPDRSGRDLAAEIRRQHLPCAVVLITGAATSPDDPSIAAPGVDAVLPKPCTDAELASALRVARAATAPRAD